MDDFVDIDEILRSYETCSKEYEITENGKNKFKRQTAILEEEVTKLQSDRSSLQQEKSRLTRLVCLQQSNLESLSNLREINQQQESEMKNLKQDIKHLIMEKSMREKEFEKKLLEVHELHEETIESTREQITKKHKEEMEGLLRQIGLKEEKMASLEDALNQLEKDSEEKMMKLDLENKKEMMKLRDSVKQSTVENTKTETVNANREIYRRKLEHLRSVHEREIANYRKQISEMEKKVKSATFRPASDYVQVKSFGNVRKSNEPHSGQKHPFAITKKNDCWKPALPVSGSGEPARKRKLFRPETNLI